MGKHGSPRQPCVLESEASESSDEDAAVDLDDCR